MSTLQTGRFAWRTAQAGLWLAGLAELALLAWRPAIGLHALWNVLIPVAPALLVFAPGLWRNVCPLGTTSLIPRHAGLSGHMRLGTTAQAWMSLGGAALLIGIVPLRHISLNTDGPLTAAVLAGVAILALGSGFVIDAKSAWCAGLCPVHPVEKLYGRRPVVTLPNAHCGSCRNCVAVCPDSTVARTGSPEPLPGRLVQALMVGAFPGFVWGWFQVPDAVGWPGWMEAFAWPLGAAAATLLLWTAVPKPHRRHLPRVAAFAAISTYYWYRLPMLIGLGAFPGDGMLVDLRGSAPEWLPWLLRLLSTSLFAWWFLRPAKWSRPWLLRPPYAEGAREGAA